MTLTMVAISVACLTEDQEDGDLILDLMVDLINMVSYLCTVCSTCFHIFQNQLKNVEYEMMYKMGKHVMSFFVLISKVFYKILLENGVEIK